jgi:hypothetical protein
MVIRCWWILDMNTRVDGKSLCLVFVFGVIAHRVGRRRIFRKAKRLVDPPYLPPNLAYPPMIPTMVDMLS